VELLGDVPFDVRLLAEWPGVVAPVEDGDSYAANALLKARAASRITGSVALGDDSGLEVDALGGAPGLLSARYGGPGLDDAGRVQHLLRELRDVPEERRTAGFRCVIAIVEPGADPGGHPGRGPGGHEPGDREWLVEGVVDGLVALAPRGRGGFGYDPVFFYPPLGRTFGELSGAEKAAVSHRGLAVQAARRLLAG
jgi:XTP/dITP diphosphohydrolase